MTDPTPDINRSPIRGAIPAVILGTLAWTIIIGVAILGAAALG